MQTWSETGQTQMLPCFCRSLEVMTAEGRGAMWGLSHQHTQPPCPHGPAPSQSAMQFRLRLWRKRDWMERVCRESNWCHPCPLPAPAPCPRHVTWGMVFIRLYLCTSSSFEGIRCCPFPIPADNDTAVIPGTVGWGHGCHRAAAPQGDAG